MFHLKLKEIFNNSIYNVCSNIDSFVYNPRKDYSRVRKLPPDKVISYLVSQGASSTKYEWLDFFFSCHLIHQLNIAVRQSRLSGHLRASLPEA